MITFILCTIGSGLFCFIKPKKCDFASRIIFFILGSVAGAAGGLLLAWALSEIVPHTSRMQELDKIKLVALADGGELHGFAYLGSGKIDTEQYYKFYYQTVDGGVKFDKLNAMITTVYEENRKDAYKAELYKKNGYSEKIKFWFVLKFFEGPFPDRTYVIHIPKGTIRTEYKLDLK